MFLEWDIEQSQLRIVVSHIELLEVDHAASPHIGAFLRLKRLLQSCTFCIVPVSEIDMCA